ncbi:MAG TPA: hypothetical protein VMB91_03055 [Solirubrobacteraceae bacterium]|nr:hypothetical protein [Solirubrobacteraceae bacterium]
MPTPEDVRAPRPESNGHAGTDSIDEGVLANLPRSRPQRATERRIASRGGRAQGPRAGKTATRPAAKAGSTTVEGAGDATAAPKRATKPASPRKPRRSTKPRARAAPKAAPPKAATPKAATAKTAADSAPRQGFESEPSRSSTGPVQPPGGAELVAGAVEIVGEVARAGVSASERVLKDLFSRLRP